MGIQKRVTATEANRNFSSLLRRVRAGEEVAITSHGKAVVIMKPAEADAEGRSKNWRKLMARLRRQKPRVIEPWTRDEL
jgi:prevent-host-death family protein